MIREAFLERTNAGITTTNGMMYLQKPRPPAAQINIRAVPTEVEESEIRQKIAQHKCGTVREVKLIYHKGTTLHNGYRQITIEDYVPGKLPPFIYLGQAPCKVYPPNNEGNETCFKCLQRGHTVLQD